MNHSQGVGKDKMPRRGGRQRRCQNGRKDRGTQEWSVPTPEPTPEYKLYTTIGCKVYNTPHTWGRFLRIDDCLVLRGVL